MASFPTSGRVSDTSPLSDTIAPKANDLELMSEYHNCAAAAHVHVLTAGGNYILTSAGSCRLPGPVTSLCDLDLLSSNSLNGADTYIPSIGTYAQV